MQSCTCLIVGEACWWTIHPASKQRSEGEKVRIGDDLILVSLSSERYLVRFSLKSPFRYVPEWAFSNDNGPVDLLNCTFRLWGALQPTDLLLNIVSLCHDKTGKCVRSVNFLTAVICFTPPPSRQLGHYQIITIASSNVDGEVLPPLLSDRQKQNMAMHRKSASLKFHFFRFTIILHGLQLLRPVCEACKQQSVAPMHP